MSESDPYDFRAPGFIPNEFNSLLVTEAEGRTRGGLELKETGEAVIAKIRESVPDIGDTEIIVYDGDLYIVGDYIRHLMTTEE